MLRTTLRNYALEYCLAVAVLLLVAQLATPTLLRWWNRPQPGQLTDVTEAVYPYVVYLPQEYAARSNERWPLLIYLHGAGARGTDLQRLRHAGLPAILNGGRHLPMVVVSPQCPAGESWDPLRLVLLLDDFEAQYRTNDVFVSGFSMGGSGAWNLATSAPDRITAIIPVSGGGQISQADKLKDMPIWAFHGEKDSVVPISASSNMVDAVNAAGGKAKLTTYPKAGHGIWQQVYGNDNLYEWLLSNKR